MLYIENIPSPYRVDFFNELGKNCDLTVLYESDSEGHRNRGWYKYNSENYTAIYLKKKTVFGRTVCWDIIHYLNKQYDCIVVGEYNTITGIIAMQYLRLKKRPFIISVDGGMKKEKELKLRKYIKKYLLSHASFWLSSSSCSDNYLEYYGARKNSIYRYNFTSLTNRDLKLADEYLTRRDELREKLHFSEEKIVITVGRFNLDAGRGKGYDTLMKIAVQLRDQNIGFYFIGDEPTEEFLLWKKSEKLENVHFVGFKHKSELNEYYAASDLFVLLTRGDVWGLAINEAMSFSLPIITTDKCVAGLELIRDGENGYIVPVDEPVLTSKKIVDILYNLDQTAVRKQSKQIISDYTIERMAQQHFEIFKGLVKNG